MITLVEALNYRCLRYVSRPLGPFHVLVGPNASGKTTFLDVVGFLRRPDVSEGLDERGLDPYPRNPKDLLFLRQGETGLNWPSRHVSPMSCMPADRETGAGHGLGTRWRSVSTKTQRQFELKAERFLLKEKAGGVELPHRAPVFPSSFPPARFPAAA